MVTEPDMDNTNPNIESTSLTGPTEGTTEEAVAPAKELIRLEIENVLRVDAAEIMAARTKALIIHHSKDIDAAGDEVEQSIRNVLRRKLGSNYYVGHGHLVDSELTTSPQMDVVISERTSSPILFTTANGTEYFPFEAVYAYGEVKSAYYKSKNYIAKFVETNQYIREKLVREQTPSNYLGMGINLGPELTTGIASPYRNPLFSFMFFVAANDFVWNDLKELFSQTANRFLPNVVCLLNKGLILNVSSEQNDDGTLNITRLLPNPEFQEATKETNGWAFLEFNPLPSGEAPMGSNLAYFYYFLSEHLRSCVLLSPDIFTYLSKLFGPYGAGVIHKIPPPDSSITPSKAK